MRPGEVALNERDVVLVQIESQPRVAAIEAYHLPARRTLAKGALQAPPVRLRQHIGRLSPVLAFHRLVALDVDERRFFGCRHVSKQHPADFRATLRHGPEALHHRGIELVYQSQGNLD